MRGGGSRAQLKVNALTSKQCNNLWLSAKRTRIAIEETCELHNLTYPLHMLHPFLSPCTTLSFVLSSPASYNNRVLCAKFNLPETTKQKKAGRNGGRKEVIRGLGGCREVPKATEGSGVVQKSTGSSCLRLHWAPSHKSRRN